MLLGPPGTGKTHSRSRSGSARVSPVTAWLSPRPPSGSRRLLDGQRLGRISSELRRLGRTPLVVVWTRSAMRSSALK